MTPLYAAVVSLVASASTPVVPSRPDMAVAKTYLELVQAADAFDVEGAIAARDRLFGQHSESMRRLGEPARLPALSAIGERVPARAFDWWQGPSPEKEARAIIVWWHPDRHDSLRVVLGAQALGDFYDLPVVAAIPDGTLRDRKAAGRLVAICPDVTFAAASTRVLGDIDIEDVPQVSVVEDGIVVWNGTWEQLHRTPLSP